MARLDILQKQIEIENWVKEGKSKAYICKELNCKLSTLNKYLKIMNMQYSGNKAGKGISKKRNDYMPLEEYLIKSTFIHSDNVKKKLLKEGYKKHQCEKCGNTTWLGKPIPLELHHKDGNHYNNELKNFELLCPNCHSFTDSYRGRNQSN